MNPVPRTARFSARFLAGLLIAGQLAWGPTAHASDTLRTGQEAQTQAAGLEQTLTAGVEEDWRAELNRWKEIYKRKRRALKNAPALDEKMAILKEIHEQLAYQEIQQIFAREKSRDSPYPIVEKNDPGRWMEGLRADATATWDERTVLPYYYHGTSLGVAVAAAQMGTLGGIPELSEWLEIQNEFKSQGAQKTIPGASYFLTPEGYPEEKDRDRTDVRHLLEDASSFSDRSIRPAQAVLIYDAFRTLWEQRGQKQPFPPMSYFLQRAVLRIPKEDIPNIQHRDAVGPGGFQEYWTDQPVPLRRAQILVDSDIPLPKFPLHQSDHVVEPSDPENLDYAYSPYYGRKIPDQDRRTLDAWITQWQETTFVPFVNRTAIGNLAMQRWKTIQGFLPAAGVEETILLIGADPDGRIEGIIRDVFPAADIQLLELPLSPRMKFRGIDVAVLTEFDEEAKETLAQAHRDGRISNLIAPDHWDEQLDDYPLREALEGFRDTLAGLEEPTDAEMGEVIEILWSETEPARRAEAEKRLREWLIIPLEQPPAPPRSASPQDAIRTSVNSLLDEMERTEERRSSALHAFARMLSKIQSANQDLVLGRPGILPVIRDWFRMESEARARIKERLDELVQTLSEEVDKLRGEQPNSRRKRTARLDRPLVRQSNVYQEEQAAELGAILTQVKDKMNETTNRSTQREEQVSRRMELSQERVKQGDPLLRELPFVGMNKQSGLEENVLRERWHGIRSAAEGPAAVVIGPSVTAQFGGLEELARLDGGRRIFLDRGADTALQMLEVGIAEARYYGGLEEAGVFQRMVTGAVSVSRHAPTEGPFLTQVGELLRLAGVPEPIIQAGLEELARDLEAVAEAA